MTAPLESLSQALLRTERERAEHRLARVRLLVFCLGALAVGGFSLVAAGDDVLIQRRAILILLAGAAWAAAWLFARRGRPFKTVHAYASTAVDLAFVLGLTFNWSILPSGLVPTQARFGIGWGTMFLVIAVTALRFDWRAVLVITAEAVLGFAGYVLFVAHFAGIRFTTRTDESLSPDTLNSVDFGGRIVLLLVCGGVVAYLVYRAQRVLLRSVHVTELKEHLRQFVSTNVVEEIETGRANLDLSGHRKRVTIMFCDLKGFTPLSETMPPEQLLDLLNGYYEAVAAAIFEHGGTLDKYVGDGVMALFGAPRALPNSSLAAVRCAAAMLEKVQAYGKAVGRPLQVGIGLHTAEVVVGNLGTASFKNYTAIGEGVNLAARIETATRQSTAALLFSEEVRAELPAEWAATPAGEFSLKGVSRPVPLFALSPVGPPARG